MFSSSCPDDIDSALCRRLVAEVAKEIEGSTFTQSYRLNAILDPLIGRSIYIPSSYIAKIPLRPKTWSTRLYLALYDAAEYVIYHVIYSGDKRVDKDYIYFKDEVRHHVSAVRLGPKSCDLLSYGKIHVDEDKEISKKVHTYWLMGQAFNRPTICDQQLCGSTASYLRILNERDGAFHTYSIAIANMSSHILNNSAKLHLPLLLTRHRIYKAYAKLITYNPIMDRLEPVTLQVNYVNTCKHIGVTPGPHLLLYGPALENHIIAVPLTCTCAGRPTKQCNRSLYYHISILALALLIHEKKNKRTIYSKLARKAYKIMEPGEAGHISYNEMLKILSKELGENYRIVGLPLKDLIRSPIITEYHGLRKGEKLLQRSLNTDCKIIL